MTIFSVARYWASLSVFSVPSPYLKRKKFIFQFMGLLWLQRVGQSSILHYSYKNNFCFLFFAGFFLKCNIYLCGFNKTHLFLVHSNDLFLSRTQRGTIFCISYLNCKIVRLCTGVLVLYCIASHT